MAIADGTKIEWTHIPGYRGETWNPVTGCDRISPGCSRCYARTMARRLKAMGQPHYQRDGDGPGFGVSVHPDALKAPLRWRKPRAVFVNSMSDLFHDEVPDDFICQVFDTMRACSPEGGGITANHIFMVLTKRPERMRDVCQRLRFDGRGEGRVWLAEHADDRDGYALMGGLPGCKALSNVWLGVSIENSRFTWRADVLRQIPAAVRFISAEPLLGSLFSGAMCKRCGGSGLVPPRSECGECVGAGVRGNGAKNGHHGHAPLDLTGIDWVIAGGESGPGARRTDPAWISDLIVAVDKEQFLRRHHVALFVKQLGRVLGNEIGCADQKGNDTAAWPSDFLIREFPESRA